MTASQAKQPITPLVGVPRSLAAVTFGLASFMAVVDITVANVSVPTISGNLGVSPEEGEWTITFFAISNAICIPLTGWLGRRFGQARLFAGSVAAFTLASILCGLAPTFETLLIARVLQGAVAGPIVPLSQALLVAVFPPEKRTFAVAMWAMTNMAGPVAGPMLGGWITDQFSWPWIFLINAPVGVFVVISAGILLRGKDTPTVRLPVDVVGLALLAIAVGCLQVTFDRGRTLDWFASPLICATATISVVGFVLLVVWELGEAHPIVDLRLFEFRNFAIGTLSVAVGFGLYFAALVLVPLWLQTDLGYSSTWAGVATAPMGVFGIVLAPFLGRWVATHGPRLYASIAFAAWALVALWRSTMTTGVTVADVALIHLAQGIGIAFFLTPVVSLSLAGLPPDKLASASGLQTAIRMMAGSLCASIAQTFWDERARFHRNHLVDAVTELSGRASTAINQLQSTGLTEQQSWTVINQQIDVQARMLSLNDFFYVSAFAFAAALGIIWLARGPKQST
ncbi:DHA2 family efflux MFS transporter permease subunit [Rhodopseudomonas palustris]|uniref:DHA2 family efflux MFS transporter permease subunit n=1 Tax=Rhodopseudomonas palustris TaxID=1076 RepID=UPI0022F05A6B|nr:DHA2 family efflux MFS transporter permease subunit [Rhodopseudomonas palustris]WBU28871.1 DHA2 family efflux MFS transporter permease subunit [Rhodopseudomonas palustris]